MPIDSTDSHYERRIDFSADHSPEVTLSTDHVLKPVHDGAEDKSIETPDWILGVLLLILALLAWVRVYHAKRLGQLFQAFLYKLHVYKILHSSDSLITRLSLALNAIFILSMSIFILQMLQYYNLKLPYSDTVNPYLIILVVVALVYPLKALMMQLIGWIFNDVEKLTEYNFHVFLLNKILGLALIPIVILLAYLSYGQFILLWIGVGLIALSFMYRLYRGYSIGRASANLAQFYIFLYLCTLEILPLVVATRYISGKL